jgi:hypothetical protein
MKLDSSIAAPILIGSVLPPELSSPPVDSPLGSLLASVDSVEPLELEPPPPQAARTTLAAKTMSINPSFQNGDLKVTSSYLQRENDRYFMP